MTADGWQMTANALTQKQMIVPCAGVETIIGPLLYSTLFHHRGINNPMEGTQELTRRSACAVWSQRCHRRTPEKHSSLEFNEKFSLRPQILPLFSI